MRLYDGKFYREQGYGKDADGTPHCWLYVTGRGVCDVYSVFYYTSSGVNGWDEVPEVYLRRLKKVSPDDAERCRAVYNNFMMSYPGGGDR
jgi:hypothetical protein